MPKSAAVKKGVAMTKLPPPGELEILEPWEIELAKEAKADKAKEVLGTPRVNHKGGILTIDDVKVADNKLVVAAVDYAFVKEYYEGEYDPSSHETPACFAIGKDEQVLVPHPTAPAKQSVTCAVCPHNVFGTALRGGGKRCKDTRRVMLVVSKDDPESIQRAEVRQISVPPGSLRNWGTYLKGLEEITPFGIRGVVTEISTQPGKKGAHELTFKANGKLTKEGLRALANRRASVQDGLLAAFPAIKKEERPAPNAKRTKKIS